MDRIQSKTSEYDIDILYIFKRLLFNYKLILFITGLLFAIGIFFYKNQDKEYKINLQLTQLDELEMHIPNKISNELIGSNDIANFALMSVVNDLHTSIEYTLNTDFKNFSNIDKDKVMNSFQIDKKNKISFESFLSAEENVKLVLNALKHNNQALISNLTEKGNYLYSTKKLLNDLEIENASMSQQKILQQISTIQKNELKSLEVSLDILRENLIIAESISRNEKVENTDTVDMDMFVREGLLKESNNGGMNSNAVNQLVTGAILSAVNLGLPSYLSGAEVLMLEIDRIEKLINTKTYRGIGSSINSLKVQNDIIEEDPTYLKRYNLQNEIVTSAKVKNAILSSDYKSFFDNIKNGKLDRSVSFNINSMSFSPLFLGLTQIIIIFTSIGLILSFFIVLIKETFNSEK